MKFERLLNLTTNKLVQYYYCLSVTNSACTTHVHTYEYYPSWYNDNDINDILYHTLLHTVILVPYRNTLPFSNIYGGIFFHINAATNSMCARWSAKRCSSRSLRSSSRNLLSSALSASLSLRSSSLSCRRVVSDRYCIITIIGNNASEPVFAPIAVCAIC